MMPAVDTAWITRAQTINPFTPIWILNGSAPRATIPPVRSSSPCSPGDGGMGRMNMAPLSRAPRERNIPCEHLLELRGRHRAAEIEALDLVATFFAQLRELVRRFNALGNNYKVQAVAE